MAIARNWLKTLFNASFKGVPFFVEQDDEEGGRRIVIHEFPMRDTPFLEDLGESKRGFDIDAYVASDSAESDAAAVIAVCAARGVGTLVLPTHGPLMVRCLDFSRNREKDRHGYIALRLKFVREGATGALASVPMLANLVFVQADNLAKAVAAAFASAVQLVNVADFVFAEAVDGLQDGIATLDAIRTSEPVTPAVSSIQRNILQTAFDQVAATLEEPDDVTTTPLIIVSSARALADAMEPMVALKIFEQIITEPSMTLVVRDPYPTPRQRSAAINQAEALRVTRLAAIAVYCEAVARIPLADRPSAITLRANVADYLEAELGEINANDHSLYRAVTALRDSTIEYLSRSIIDLAPVFVVNANLSMPSLYWAWRLYADPNRSTEIAARNLVPHPSFVPPTFEALSK